jgi:hypothetical protein
MVMVDQILDTLLDMFTPYVTIAFGKDSEEEKVKMQSCLKESFFIYMYKE